jgi:transmembrane sensor
MQELFAKYLDNKCSPDEVAELLAYCNIAENEKLLRELILESLEKIDVHDDWSKWRPPTDKMFAVIKKRLNPEKAKVVPFLRKRWLRVAAALVLIAGGIAIYNFINYRDEKHEIAKTVNKQEMGHHNKAILTLADLSTINLESTVNGTLTQQGLIKIVKPADGLLAYISLNKKPTEVLFNRISTPRGGAYRLELSDGSKVWLNAASSLRFPAGFAGGERKVQLSGEAYFEVAKNAVAPFKVEVAGRGEVEVSGTRFNVNAYSDEATVNTTLLEGRVKVIGFASHVSRKLNPGEQARLDGNGHISINKNADTEQAIAWKNGVFNFSNADAMAVLRQLSRWYDVDIKFESRVPVRQFSGEIQRDLKLSQVLRLLEKNGVFCKLQGKTLIVLK